MLNPQDLQRVSAEKAAAVLVLCNKFSSDPSEWETVTPQSIVSPNGRELRLCHKVYRRLDMTKRWHYDIMTIWHYDNMSWTSMEILHVMESPPCLAQSGPPLCLIVCRPTWWQTKWWPHRLTSHFCRVMLTSSHWLVLGSERKDIPPSYCPIYLFCFLKPSGYAFSTSKTRENAIFP